MDWYQPDIEVDAILAKRNLGTKLEDAPIVVGVGPDLQPGETVILSWKQNGDMSSEE